MSNASDGPGQPGNIDTIKELLRKLEEVAVRDPAVEEQKSGLPLASATPAADAAPNNGAPKDAASKGDALLALKRGTSLKTSGEASAARPIVIDTAPSAAALPAPATPSYPAARSSGSRRGIAIAAGSFVLGVAAAGALILAYQPVSQVFRGPAAPAGSPSTIAAKPEQRTQPETQRETPPPAEAVKVEQAQAPSSAQPEQAVKPAFDKQEAPAKPANSEPSRVAGTSEPAAVPAPVQVRAQPAPPAQATPPTVDRVAEVAYRIEMPDRVDLRAGERRTVDIRLFPAVSETTRLLVVLRNVPAWLSLSKGGAVGKEIWLLPAHQSTDVSLEAAEGANGSAEIKVQLASIDGRIVAERTLAVRSVGLPASNAPMVASAPAGNDQMIQRLQARGELLLDTGELEAARTLFRTAAEAGSVSAALRLAETYDPGEIQRFGMMETAADPVMAVRWYEHAQALGSPVATARLATLGRR